MMQLLYFVHLKIYDDTQEVCVPGDLTQHGGQKIVWPHQPDGQIS